MKSRTKLLEQIHRARSVAAALRGAETIDAHQWHANDCGAFEAMMRNGEREARIHGVRRAVGSAQSWQRAL
eukprot:4841361-Alexandrium_andersonii.AAC.1